MKVVVNKSCNLDVMNWAKLNLGPSDRTVHIIKEPVINNGLAMLIFYKVRKGDGWSIKEELPSHESTELVNEIIFEFDEGLVQTSDSDLLTRYLMGSLTEQELLLFTLKYM